MLCHSSNPRMLAPSMWVRTSRSDRDKGRWRHSHKEKHTVPSHSSTDRVRDQPRRVPFPREPACHFERLWRVPIVAEIIVEIRDANPGTDMLVTHMVVAPP